MNPTPEGRRAERRMEPDSRTGCWLWFGTTTPTGYGQIGVRGKTRYAHRVMYEAHRGPIPDGLEIDHRCRVRHCVNPEHLELVTHRENQRRGAVARNAYVTFCPSGHEYDEANTYHLPDGRRNCRACRRAREAARYWRRRNEAWDATVEHELRPAGGQ